MDAHIQTAQGTCYTTTGLWVRDEGTKTILRALSPVPIPATSRAKETWRKTERHPICSLVVRGLFRMMRVDQISDFLDERSSTRLLPSETAAPPLPVTFTEKKVVGFAQFFELCLDRRVPAQQRTPGSGDGCLQVSSPRLRYPNPTSILGISLPSGIQLAERPSHNTGCSRDSSTPSCTQLQADVFIPQIRTMSPALWHLTGFFMRLFTAVSFRSGLATCAAGRCNDPTWAASAPGAGKASRPQPWLLGWGQRPPSPLRASPGGWLCSSCPGNRLHVSATEGSSPPLAGPRGHGARGLPSSSPRTRRSPDTGPRGWGSRRRTHPRTRRRAERGPRPGAARAPAPPRARCPPASCRTGPVASPRALAPTPGAPTTAPPRRGPIGCT